jgi:hypothetical protein
VETDQPVVSPPNSAQAKAKLTGRQKLMVGALLFLQVPSSLIFYPVAALFSITGVGVPVSLVLMGIGTLPYSSAMKCKTAWQDGRKPGH